jgi:DNA-binding response OmpR family regulator
MVGQGEHDEFILKDLSLDSYDYILRPFKFKELKTKINLLLNNQEILNSPVRRDKLIIDLKNGIVTIKDQIIQLSRTELRLLMLLSKRDRDVVDFKKITKLLESEKKTIQISPLSIINRLREKLKRKLGESIEIIQIPNVGIRFELKA